MAVHRIVKMKFKKEHCADFEALFGEIRNKIAAQKGLNW